MSLIVCCGDTHLGKSAALYEGRLAEQEAVWGSILTLARERDADLVLHAGDMWEHRKPTPEQYLAAERPLVRHRDAGGPTVVVACGNHDRSGVDASLALHVLAEAGLITLSTEPQTFMTGKTTLCTLPWVSAARLVADQGGGDRDDINAHAAELLVEAARGLRAQVDGPAVLLGHWAVSGSVTPSGLPVEPHVFREPVIPLTDLAALDFDAFCLGHIHTPGLFAGLLQPPIWYVGSPLPLDFAEGGVAHGCWLLELDDDLGAHIEFVPVESRPFVVIDVDAGNVAFDPKVVDGAVVWARVRGEGAAGFDTRELREALLEGAHYARVTVEVEPASRPRRGVEVGDDLSPAEALGMWLAEAGVNGADGARLVERGRTYLEGAS